MVKLVSLSVLLKVAISKNLSVMLSEDLLYFMKNTTLVQMNYQMHSSFKVVEF